MIRVLCLLALTGLLVACGADGEPERPERPTQSGIAITGSASIGVTGGR